MRLGRGARRALLPLLAFGLTACELAEVTVAEPTREVVAEAYVRVGVRDFGGGPGNDESHNSASVVLHETLDAAGKSGPVRGARIAITRVADGLVVRLPEASFSDSTVANLMTCVSSFPEDSTGTCYYSARNAEVNRFAPGDRLSLRIELADGRVLSSEAIVPGRFDLLQVADGGRCAILPKTGSDIRWTRSSGAWSYVADTYITGLSRTIPVKQIDPLYLFGLAISAQDTAIVFPREFGVFARGDLDHEVSIALQTGLPDSTTASVSVAAVERNWVNWARGAGFNPSGQVRVPSVRGDGTGVFGLGVVRSFRVVSTSRPSGLPSCPADAAAAGGA